ncbi:MAG: hypothetical protein JWO04_797 [Gammaproteobacteria bacterium]|nr:hypothetical protein [Gammaproteobacteria bacterium]
MGEVPVRVSASSPGGGEPSALPTHGAQRLPGVDVDSYSLKLEDEDGFAGDKAAVEPAGRTGEAVRPPSGSAGRRRS